MRKKYLSALLFGALLFASAGTFTSCKDYDDDISNLQTQVDDVKSEVEALQTKINEGLWITNIADAAGGFTITFSDNSTYTITNGQDGADGADGAAGAPGTQWTISEDGYWVCDGEKTDVKAVGQDGKDGADGADGQDAQPEVKKENGKWYLWNGTEFEELNITAPTANVPYYYVDPNDNNYAILVISDANGLNQREIRLPLTEGLAQIQVLRCGEQSWDNDLSINYAISREGAAFEEWNGPKEKPAKGEYIITQSTDSILVQVTPANYDLAALDLKVVNANNEEVPVTLGAPVPYKGKLTDYSRAASTTGMYLIPVVHETITDENTEEYKDLQFVSIVANEKVRSAFDGSFRFSLNDAENYSNNIEFGQYIDENSWYNDHAYVEPGASFTVDVVNDREYLYDAYVTMYDGSEMDESDWDDAVRAKITQAKADQVRYGIEADGLTITCNDNAAGRVDFSIHYMDVTGRVHHEPFTVYYQEEATPAETIALENVAHTATGKTDNQYIIVDLAPYFETMTAEERLIWNDEYDTYRNNWQTKRFMVEYYEAFEDQNGNLQSGIKWEYEDTETGRTITDFGYEGLLGTDAYNIEIVALKADGTEATQGSEVAKLKIPFANNYGGYAMDAENAAKGQYNVKVAVMNWVKNSEGNYNDYEVVAYLDVPFTLAEPTAAELSAQYTYNSFYYNATDDRFTIVDRDYFAVSDLITCDRLNTAELKAVGANNYNGEVSILGGRIYWTGTDNDGKEVAKGTVYSFTGATFKYLNGMFDIPTFNVRFVNSQPYSLNMASANVTVQSGNPASTDNIVYAEKATKDEPIFYNVKDVFSQFVAADQIASVEIVDFVSPTGQTGAPLLEIPEVNPSTKAITVTATTEKASQDSKVTVKVKAIVRDANTNTTETVEGQFTVTVKAYPLN